MKTGENNTGLGLMVAIMQRAQNKNSLFGSALKKLANLSEDDIYQFSEHFNEEIIISREPFDFQKFVRKGNIMDRSREWQIFEQDERALLLGKIDRKNIKLIDVLEDDEELIGGEKRFKRLKERNFIRLDMGVFITLWENKSLIPDKWKEGVDNSKNYITFDGTIFCDEHGNKVVLCMFWGGFRWEGTYKLLRNEFYKNHFSAVVEV